jgi:hypothetical protein
LESHEDLEAEEKWDGNGRPFTNYLSLLFRRLERE